MYDKKKIRKGKSERKQEKTKEPYELSIIITSCAVFPKAIILIYN